MNKVKSSMHSLRRTSPYRESFVGTCVLCGKEGLTIKDMNKRCRNVAGKTQDEALIDAITGSPSA